jgi:hypothetical protein
VLDPHPGIPEETKHWRRLLVDGVEFHFAAGAQSMTGTVAPAEHADDLQRLFEEAYGVELPAPEWRQQRRGKALLGTSEGGAG